MSSQERRPKRLRIPVPFPVGHMNAYLLRGDPLTLVDCGSRWQQSLAGLEQALREQGLRVEDVELLVLTHQHEDHVGLAASIQRRSGCRIAGHDLLVGLLEDEPAARAADEAYAVALLQLHGAPDKVVAEVPRVSAATHDYTESLSLDVRLRDGDSLTAGGEELRVALRPGHSPTDTIYVSSEGWAVVGDHLLRDSPAVTVAHRPPVGPADPRERPRALLAYRESLAASARQGLGVGYPGHGERIDDPAAAIADRLSFQERRAERLLRELEGEPRTAWELAASIWQAGAQDEIHPLPVEYIVLSDVLGHLDLLVESGRAREHDEGRRLVFEATDQ